MSNYTSVQACVWYSHYTEKQKKNFNLLKSKSINYASEIKDKMPSLYNDFMNRIKIIIFESQKKSKNIIIVFPATKNKGLYYEINRMASFEPIIRQIDSEIIFFYTYTEDFYTNHQEEWQKEVLSICSLNIQDFKYRVCGHINPEKNNILLFIDDIVTKEVNAKLSFDSFENYSKTIVEEKHIIALSRNLGAPHFKDLDTEKYKINLEISKEYFDT